MYILTASFSQEEQHMKKRVNFVIKLRLTLTLSH